MIQFATAILGLWLLGTIPLLHVKITTIFYSDLISAILLIFLGLFLRTHSGVWKAWVIGAIGVWLNFAPLALWAHSFSLYLNNTLVGTAALAIFLISPFTAKSLPDAGPSVPPGWSYNPSSYAQRLPVLLLAFVCWMISRYLAGYQLGYIDTMWDPFFDTLKVIESDISKSFPISDAGLGAFAYSLEFLSAFGGVRRWRTSPWLVLAFGILTIPLSLTSILLIILQPVAVGAWCTLCLINAVLMLIPIPYALDEVAASLQYLFRSKEKPFWQLVFHGGHCPGSQEDRRSPQLDAPLAPLLRAAHWGVTVPWNLALSALVGVWIMMSPFFLHLEGGVADLDHIFGALTIVVAIVSMSEVIRSWRLANIALGATLFIGAFFAPAGAMAAQIIAAAAIILFAMRRGPVREKTALELGGAR